MVSIDKYCQESELKNCSILRQFLYTTNLLTSCSFLSSTINIFQRVLDLQGLYYQILSGEIPKKIAVPRVVDLVQDASSQRLVQFALISSVYLKGC